MGFPQFQLQTEYIDLSQRIELLRQQRNVNISTQSTVSSTAALCVRVCMCVCACVCVCVCTCVCTCVCRR